MSIFYEGQKVGCLLFGEGVIQKIDAMHIYADIDNCIRVFYLNGGYYELSRPTLYPLEQYRQIIANLPAPEAEKWKPKVGEWCWFWDDDSTSVNQPVLCQFEGIKGGLFQGEFYKWQHCAPFTGELPPHLKEVQP